MKILLVCFVLFVGTVLAADDKDWKKWCSKHNKTYSSPDEEAKRKAIWQEKHNFINNCNSNTNATFTCKHYHHSDMTMEEIKAALMGLGPNIPKSRMAGATMFDERGVTRASSIDWRTSGVVNPIKDQQQCGSCWAFSTIQALEGQWYMHTGKLLSFSEEQLVDCAQPYGPNGCGGGWPYESFNYLKSTNYGAQTETTYPYLSYPSLSNIPTQSCKYNPKSGVAQVTGYVQIPQGSESALQAAVSSVGPLSICVDAAIPAFMNYASGILSDPTVCSSNPMDVDHCIGLVGYVTTGPTPYYIARNQWGTGWGQSGYIYIAMNAGNVCGVANYATYPTVGTASG